MRGHRRGNSPGQQGATIDNLIDFTPELRQDAIAITKNDVIGPVFTPPSIRSSEGGGTRGTIQLPGSVGGADWQGAAFDPETGMLYVPSITTRFVADIIPGDPKQTDLRYTRGTRRWMGGPRGLPLFKPPYGRITAIDLKRGEQRWMVPNGDGSPDHPAIKHLNLGPLGNPGRAAPVLTKSLLFVGEGSRVGFKASTRRRGRCCGASSSPLGQPAPPSVTASRASNHRGCDRRFRGPL